MSVKLAGIFLKRWINLHLNFVKAIRCNILNIVTTLSFFFLRQNFLTVNVALEFHWKNFVAKIVRHIGVGNARIPQLIPRRWIKRQKTSYVIWPFSFLNRIYIYMKINSSFINRVDLMSQEYEVHLLKSFVSVTVYLF